jgi:hypothetical protein
VNFLQQDHTITIEGYQTSSARYNYSLKLVDLFNRYWSSNWGMVDLLNEMTEQYLEGGGICQQDDGRAVGWWTSSTR